MAAVAGTAAWGVFGRGDHPFDDARACEASELPLRQALDDARLTLPAGATDVHYITHTRARSDGVRLAVSFHSTRGAMHAYLRGAGLVTEGLDNLDDGRFDLGDVGRDPATLHLCGGAPHIAAPAALIEKRRARVDGTPETVDVAVQLNASAYGSIRPSTDVLLTVRDDTAP